MVNMKRTEQMLKLNPTRRGLWIGHQEGGGAFNARPYKNPFKGLFGPIFLHRKGWGIKITSEKFFEIGFLSKKYHFCVLFA